MTSLGPFRRTGSLVRSVSPDEVADEDCSTARLNPPSHSQRLSDGYDAAELKKIAYKPGRFKAVSQVVLAMNRFKGMYPP